LTLIELEELAFVHLVKDVKVKEGLRYALVRCGVVLPGEKSSERQTEWTVWEEDITCPDCYR
jgi:hypothetical protein